jgi:mannose-6-phosphate isomerase
MTILPMRNVVQHYAWGSATMLRSLRKEHGTSETADAELWMGSHPRGPSTILRPDGSEEQLRPDSVPFLFKVLTAESALSIQTHPDRITAKEGYARENEAGIPVNAPHRNYRDTNHKPELVCAVSDFWGLRGFRPVSAISSELAGVTAAAGDLPESFRRMVAEFYEEPTVQRWRTIFPELLRGRDDDTFRERLCRGGADYARSRSGRDRDDPYWWVLELQKQFPGDPGTLAPLYLNLVHLHPGEAMFLDAGTLHAYLYGAAVELMANSDNVLRAGCTVKHVDVAELVRNVVFEWKEPSPIKPSRDAPVWTFRTPAKEFELHRVVLKGDRPVTLSAAAGPVIILALENDVILDSEEVGLHLPPGESAFLELDRDGRSEKVTLSAGEEESVVFVAALPGKVTEAL